MINLYHYLLAFLGALFFGFPSRRLFVVGVTGTKGKSSTIELMSAIIEVAGKKTALLGTVRRKVDSRSIFQDGTTMPGRFALQRFLREAVLAGCDYAFIEVTSQGVIQHRHRFIEWDAACITNLQPEHIEAHGTFERYREAKLAFFRCLSRSRKRLRHFFLMEDAALLPFADAARAVPAARVEIVSPSIPFSSTENPWFLAGFNRENAALAAAFARSRGVGEDVIRRALLSFPGVPGRVEFIQKEPFAVVVDYAHTPDSLEKLYVFLRNAVLRDGGRLVCVLGSAGGGRDRWKRPKMGEIASMHCDRIFLTDEDPYDEDPREIVSEIGSGIPPDALSKADVILDRREAIRAALSLARPGDAVVLTGKGSQQSIAVSGDKKIPWDERGVVREALRKWQKEPC